MLSVPAKMRMSKDLQPSFSVLESPEERDLYARRLCRHWGPVGTQWYERSKTFPGSNPVNLSRSGLRLLEERSYAVALKSDGVRYALYLTTRPGHTATEPLPVALMVDRAYRMFEVEAVAPQAFFEKETVLEGELVWEQPKEQRMLFLVFDAVLVQGRSLLQQPFKVRLQEARKAVAEGLEGEDTRTPEDVEQMVKEVNAVTIVHFLPEIRMSCKTFVPTQYSSVLWKERLDCSHSVDGLILQDEDAPYIRGKASDGAAFKWKEHLTVDLKVRKTGEERSGEEPAWPGGSAVVLETAQGSVPGSMLGRSVRCVQNKVTSDLEHTGKDHVMEFLVTVDAFHVHLFPLRCRLDKNHPNSLAVFQSIVEDCVKRVSVEELTAGTPGSRQPEGAARSRKRKPAQKAPPAARPGACR